MVLDLWFEIKYYGQVSLDLMLKTDYCKASSSVEIYSFVLIISF